MRLPLVCASAVAVACGHPLVADPSSDMVEPVSRFVGEMAVPMATEGTDRIEVDNALRFEPLQSFDEMFLRDDVVFLMRHGPTDWDKLDVKDVAPGDCANQRILSEQGRENMRDLGVLLAFNDIRFGQIVISQWCRNQQTYDMIREGYDDAKPGVFAEIPVRTDPELNLLLALQGAPNVTDLRKTVSEWDGGDQTGPLLIISHFTNIQELTEFSVYEGEALVLDPKRDNRVLGYLRLKTAAPDVGHFDVATEEQSPGEGSSADYGSGEDRPQGNLGN